MFNCQVLIRDLKGRGWSNVLPLPLWGHLGLACHIMLDVYKSLLAAPDPSADEQRTTQNTKALSCTNIINQTPKGVWTLKRSENFWRRGSRGTYRGTGSRLFARHPWRFRSAEPQKTVSSSLQRARVQAHAVRAVTWAASRLVPSSREMRVSPRDDVSQRPWDEKKESTWDTGRSDAQRFIEGNRRKACRRFIQRDESSRRLLNRAID